MSKKRSGAYNRNRGIRAEQKVINELKELGFDKVMSSRQGSKITDDNKVDILDTEHQLPFGMNIQVKHQILYPQYFKIREQSTVPNDTFVIIWDKQETKEKNIVTVGRCAILDLSLFYKLIEFYGKSKSNIQGS